MLFRSGNSGGGGDKVSYLVVAGGGGSGVDCAGGGGGAGGFREYKGPLDTYTASPLNGNPGGTAITVTATGFPITVGAGGIGAKGPSAPSPGAGQPGTVGSPSVFSTVTSTGGGNGGVAVQGVGDLSGATGADASINGVGILGGSGSNMHIFTQWRWRHEYGGDRWVLRAIYQVDSNSWANPSHMDGFFLRFYDFGDNPVHVSKVITRDITWNNGLGAADDWMRHGGAKNPGFWAQ